MNIDPLFRPLTVKNMTLPNRIVMAPMTRYFSPGGVPTDEVAEYYRRRAAGGTGLILSEGTAVDRPFAVGDPDIPHFYGKDALAGWKKVIDGVHGAGACMGPQLWHAATLYNTQRGCGWVDRLESPSGLLMKDSPVGVVMSGEDIEDAIASFARSAAAAKNLGFDCIEIHAGHGYLVDQFFWEDTNRRDDEFGGSTLAERTRFAAEVIRAIRKAVGEDFVIGIRLSQWKQQDYTVRLANSPQEMEKWLGPMADAGVDIFHCSQRRFWEPEFDDSDLNFAGWAKKLTGKVTTTVGSVGLENDFLRSFTTGEMAAPADVHEVVERLERGEYDLVAVGRALIGDPDWANKIKTGRFDELSGFDTGNLGTLV